VVRLRLAVTVAVLAVVAVLCTGVAGASAASSPLEFSMDGGSTWSATPPDSLFPQEFRAVPGDSLEQTLLVRSTRETPTVAMVAITGAGVDDSLFGAALTVQGEDAAGAGLPPTALTAIGTCDPLVPTRVLVAGEELPVTLVVDVSPTLTRRQADDAVARFDLSIALTDPGNPTLPTGCPVDATVIAGFPTAGIAGTAPLAYTGAALVYPALGVAAATLAAGWILVGLGRRRKRHPEA
jgi:hypothetical protein